MAIPLSADLALGWRWPSVLNEDASVVARTIVGRHQARLPFGLPNGSDDMASIPGTVAEATAVGTHMDGADGMGGTGGRVDFCADPLVRSEFPSTSP